MTDLKTIQHLAEKIYQRHPDPVVRHILLRDVFYEPRSSEGIIKAQQEIEISRWVRLLKNEQWLDGSWGRNSVVTAIGT